MGTHAEPARRRSGAQVVYEVLRDRIIAGEIPPEARLYETELAKSLQVSRTPLREALRLLSAEGLTEDLPTGGTIVTPLETGQALELYQVRAVLEGLLARQATARVSKDDLDGLEQLVTLMGRLVDVEEEVLRLGRTFHTRIEEIASNHRCSGVLRQMRGLIDRYRSLSTHEKGRPREALAEHRAILTAIQAGDGKSAEDAMRRHILSGAEALAHAIGPDREAD